MLFPAIVCAWLLGVTLHAGIRGRQLKRVRADINLIRILLGL